MDIFEFTKVVSAVLFANGLTLVFLYACRDFDRAEASGQKIPWRVIFGCLVPCGIALLGLWFIQNPG